MEMPPPSHELHCTLPSSCCEQDINKKINASLGWHLMPRRQRKRSHSLSPSDRCLPPPLPPPPTADNTSNSPLPLQSSLPRSSVDFGLGPVFWVAYTRLELELCPTSLTLTTLSRRRRTPRYYSGRICPCPPHSLFIKCCMAGCCSSRHLQSFCRCRIVPADVAAETATWSVVGMVQVQAWVGQKLLNVTF